ncbi:MAG: SPOR domain-containing protein [Bacteroidota bacterium]
MLKSTEQIVITVLDAAGRKPMKGAILDFTACGEPVFKTDARGQYSFQALQGLNCDIIVSKEGYKSFAFNLNSKGKSSQSFEILLSAKNEIDYVGKVVNITNNLSIANVRIKATDQNTGLVIETTSDAVGDYHLPLEAGKEYMILYSKAGFLDTHNSVLTGDGQDLSVLGVLPLTPAGTNLDEGLVNTDPASPPRTSTPSTTDDPAGPTVTEDPIVKVKEEPIDTDDDTPEDFEAQEGYSVQVAAVVDHQKVNVGKYLKLEDYGNVYSRAEKGFKKVRIGIFPTRADAEEARKDIVRKGFDKAFIVNERVTSLKNMEFYSDLNTEPATPQAIPAQEEPTFVDSGYKVRLAAYKNLNFFNRKAVEKIGTIEQRSKGEFTIMLLSGFASLEEAQRAQRSAVSSGFNGAHIVVEENGQLKKVR